jgi:hypothetical protein
MIKKGLLLFGILTSINLTSSVNTNTVKSEYNYHEVFDDYTKQRASYDYKHLGTLSSSGTCKSESFQTKWTEGWVWGSQNTNYDTLAYAIYNVGIANASYYSEPIGYIENGSIEQIFTTTISKTYEESLTNELSTKVSSSVSTQAHYNALSANQSIESEVNSKVSTTIKISNQEVNTVSKKITFNITKPGQYFYDLRATYNMYVVQVYQINYNKVENEVRKSGFFAKDHFYKYEIKGYELIEDYVTFSLETDLGISITKYLLDDYGDLVYDGPKENVNYIYF